MTQKLTTNKNLISFFIVISIFLIDRISKIWIINKNFENNQNEIYFSKYLNIELIWNKGIAFGLLSFDKTSFYHIITIIIFIVILILMFLITKSFGMEKYSYTLISGGALGNLFDRIFYKEVPDFIDFHINDFHWFIFNTADIFITVGVLCLICIEVFKKNLNE